MRMKLTVGDKIVVPGRGPCLVGAVVHKVVCGMSVRFHRLELLDDSGAELFVPVGKANELGLRALLNRSQVPKLLRHLKPHTGTLTDPGIAKNWRQRELDNLKLFTSGSVFDLAKMVQSLTQLNNAKPLAARERETLSRARRLLICEISGAMDETKSAAEARIDSVLERGKNKTNESAN
jgi:CarD family transcriptional regulator